MGASGSRISIPAASTIFHVIPRKVEDSRERYKVQPYDERDDREDKFAASEPTQDDNRSQDRDPLEREHDLECVAAVHLRSPSRCDAMRRGLAETL
jgi:hypothetical protein